MSTTPVTANEAATEILRRRRSRSNLFDFVTYTMSGYQPSQHHQLICDKLEEVASGALKRLIIQMPPRSGKSQLASRHFPAWYLGLNPEHQVICATYNDDFAKDFGRDVRNLVGGEEYKCLFPTLSLAADSAAADRWNTSHGGAYKSAGVGGGLTGRGAHLAIIDDPMKSREEADSKLERDKIWNWYRSVLYTRLMPGGAIVLILTRWHDDDLAGRLQGASEQGGDEWEVLSLPALAVENDPLGREVGEALWPAWYPVEVLETIRANIGAREWGALYQQTPAEDEGAYFKKAWLQDYKQEALNKFRPREMINRNGEKVLEHQTHFTVYGASDYAVSDGQGDYTVHLVVGVDPADDIYLLDLWRAQAVPDVWIDKLADLILKWRPLIWAGEKGQILRSVGPFMHRRLRERKAYCRIEDFSSHNDKPTRARAIQARMSMGKVYAPENAPWMDQFLHELSRFPAGAHDDQIDALSLIGRMIDTMHAGRTHEPPETTTWAPTTMGEFTTAHRRRRRRGWRGAREAPIVRGD
tara:strand:- start:15006 stop:16586 length:1581 start_codon:yes stop_codon:yes gene_type:complete